jgi:futalosine hydrolase
MAGTLIVFASRQEFNFFFKNISAVVASSTPALIEPSVYASIAGVGVVDFSANLARFFSQKKYERAFLLGICGAYPNSELQVGDVVRVGTEVVADMGAQSREGHFIPWKTMVSEETIYKGASSRDLPLRLAAIPEVAGGTVNCCTGTQYLGNRRESTFQIQVENMEGAAFFAVCKAFGVSGYQFRAISNMASDRDESSWDIPRALTALKQSVLDHLF